MNPSNIQLPIRLILITAVALFLPAGPLGPGPALAHEAHLSNGQVIYIPAYAHIRIHGKAQTLPLTTTLFVHNTSPDAGITITSIRHYDGEGQLVQEYAPEPVKLGPLAALDVLVKKAKKGHGSGTCFVVTWLATRPISPPIAESVMVNTTGAQGISYRSTGQVIRELK